MNRNQNTQGQRGADGQRPVNAIDETVEDTYWREQFRSEPYYQAEYGYDDYAPAYRLGYRSYGEYAGRRFEDVEPELRSAYEADHGSSRLGWERVKLAARAAWDRIERAMPGDADGDGR